METVYSAEEVADLVGYSKQSVYRFIREGTLAATRSGKKYVVTERAIQDFLAGETLSPAQNAAHIHAALGRIEAKLDQVLGGGQ